MAAGNVTLTINNKLSIVSIDICQLKYWYSGAHPTEKIFKMQRTKPLPDR